MLINANATGHTDGTAWEFFNQIESELPIVVVAWDQNFVFNEELNRVAKFILADFVEYGWDFRWDAADGEKKFSSNEWKKFIEFSATASVRFKRELESKRWGSFFPIEYPCINDIPPTVTKEEFNSRPLEVFFNWGLSNPIRPEIHGKIWSEMNKFGYIVCDNFWHLTAFIQNESNPRKWLTVNTPHYARLPIENILGVNGSAKISLALHGAGIKCFRSTGESPLNSVMMLPHDDLVWTYSWVHGENCIRFDPRNNPIEQIVEATRRKDLYEIYLNGVETTRKYHFQNYKKHIEGIIKNHQ